MCVCVCVCVCVHVYFMHISVLYSSINNVNYYASSPQNYFDYSVFHFMNAQCVTLTVLLENIKYTFECNYYAFIEFDPHA